MEFADRVLFVINVAPEKIAPPSPSVPAVEFPERVQFATVRAPVPVNAIAPPSETCPVVEFPDRVLFVTDNVQPEKIAPPYAPLPAVEFRDRLLLVTVNVPADKHWIAPPVSLAAVVFPFSSVRLSSVTFPVPTPLVISKIRELCWASMVVFAAPRPWISIDEEIVNCPFVSEIVPFRPA